MVNMNTTPPEVTSVSHPTQTTWYEDSALYFSWPNPQPDANFTGYYYAFDKFADTVPKPIRRTSPPTSRCCSSNTPDGIWVFHLVNRDTRGAITKAARH